MRRKRILRTATMILASVILYVNPAYADTLRMKMPKGMEQVINLDPFLQKYSDSKQPVVIYGVTPSQGSDAGLKSGKPSSPNADGGYFWVSWGFEKHYALFDHATKVHRTSAGNANGIVQGDWVPAGIRASTWCYTTGWGNTAYWSTNYPG